MEVKKMKKAVAYCRFSSDNQRTESIDAQVRAIEEYCRKEGYTLIKIYKETRTQNQVQYAIPSNRLTVLNQAA